MKIKSLQKWSSCYNKEETKVIENAYKANVENMFNGATNEEMDNILDELDMTKVGADMRLWKSTF